MKQLKLTQGKFAMVDDEVYEWAKDYKWYAAKNKNGWYVVRMWKNFNGKFENQYLHHLVIGVTRLPKIFGLETDHKDGNGLNNQRKNLRICTRRKNDQNRIEHRKGKLLGTHKVSNCWEARIRIDKKYVYLGLFKTEQEAHDRYMQELKVRELL
jgi:hypothetical protein